MTAVGSPHKRSPARFDKVWLRRVLWVVLALSLLSLLLVASMVRRDIPLAELRARYAAPPSRFAPIEGMNVHYRDEGQGHPIVLLHGSSSSLHTWDGWTELLKTHRRVVRLDLPGFGLTGPAPDRDYTPLRLARVVGKLLDKLGLSQADLAGNSLGGSVAITFALVHPRRVRRLILIDSRGLAGQTMPLVFRLARTPLSPLLRWLTPRFALRANVEQVYGDPRLISEQLLDRYEAMTLRAGNRQATLDRLRAPDGPALDARLKELHVPTLLQWGARDRWIPLAFGQRMHSAIAGSQLLVYPKAGHVPMEELPFVTARDADAFLESTDAEPSLLDALDEDDPDVPLE